MIDAERVLRPLTEARADIDRLHEYESADELAGALRAAWLAVDRTLRLLLRAGPGVPDAERLAALSSAEMPADHVIEALRRRDLLSLELAGMAHGLEQAARRAARDEVRAADGVAALAVVDRLSREVHALEERPVRAAAHEAVLSDRMEESVQSVRPARRGRARSLAIAAAGLVLLAALVVIGVLLRGGDDAMAEGTAAFRTGRLGLAETRFRAALADEPRNATALLYLARIYRRQERYDEAADALQSAFRLGPDDADVRRELGHLFLELGRTGRAIEEYQRAFELEPGESANCVALVRAMRAAGDARAEATLRRCPAEAQAILRTGG